jgi:hypothetical protein
MLPDVGAGAPLTITWWVASFVLLGFTVIASLAIITVARYFGKTDNRDQHQDQRLIDCEARIQELNLDAVKREAKHKEQVHGLRVEVLECQKRACGASGDYITRAEHHGDMLRMQGEVKEVLGKIDVMVKAVHERIDAAFGPSTRKTE